MSVYSYIIKHTHSKRMSQTENIYIYNKEVHHRTTRCERLPSRQQQCDASLQPTHIMANIHCTCVSSSVASHERV